MTFFSASFQTVLLRYFLMMAVIIVAFTAGYPMLAVLAFPIFISAFTAVSFTSKTSQAKQEKMRKDVKEINMVNTAA
ncbi:MAG: hypothetical protein AAGA77_17475 [Bacteroidota bacterium]